MAQNIGEFREPVSGVDINQDNADAGAGHLDEHPLDIIGGPDADSFALGKTQGHQGPGQAIYLFGQFLVGQALFLNDINDCFMVGKLRGDFLEVGRNGSFKQGHLATAF